MSNGTGYIRSGISQVVCKDTLAAFLNNHLGYRTSSVSYEASDFHIPKYLSAGISEWWILSDYPGQVAFQIHLVKVNDLSFSNCKTIITSFSEKHAGGRFLFVFTKSYRYLVFMTVEWSLERKPSWGKPVWPKVPKAYCHHLLVNRIQPTHNDGVVLSSMRLQHSDIDQLKMYDQIISALKSSRPLEAAPKWFYAYTYKRFGLL